MLPMRRVFSSALLKLTLIYTCILLFVSIIFSISFYQVSIRELDANYVTQNQILQRRPIFDNIEERNEFVEAQLSELHKSKDRVFGRLVIGNAIVLAGGTLLSYFLAKKSLEPIEETHAAQARFTADASHELRTPLTAMISEIEVTLRDSKVTKLNYQDLLRSNLEELRKLTKLSDSLLRLARRDDLTSHEFEPCNIKDIVKSAYKSIEAHANDKNIEFDIKKISELSLDADPVALGEVFIILFDNAIKYSHDKSKVVVTARRRNRSRSMLVKITDEGVGMKASELPHIFDRFYRADSSRSKATDGYGLGLSLAKQIVEMHSGTINVASTPGKGTSFTIILPQ